MIRRSKERINLEIKIQYSVNSYKVITILYNIFNFYLLVNNKEIKKIRCLYLVFYKENY